jgi:hypothetical protein
VIQKPGERTQWQTSWGQQQQQPNTFAMINTLMTSQLQFSIMIESRETAGEKQEVQGLPRQSNKK